jgi:WD40 repeat protein
MKRSLLILSTIITMAASCHARSSKRLADTIKPHGLWSIEFSPDDQYFAFGGDDSLLRIYTVKDQQLFRQYKVNGVIRNIAWHPSGAKMAIATLKSIQFFDLGTEKFETIKGVSGARGLGWNHSGELLGVASNGLVHVITADGTLLRSIEKHDKKSYLALNWNPVDNTIVTGGDEIILFDTTGKQLAFIKHRKEYTGVLATKWHPNGEMFASGDYGHENEGKPTLLQFWKKDGTAIRTIGGHHKEIRNLDWNSDGTRLATASDALRIYDRDGNLISETKTGYELWGISWSNDGSMILTASYAKDHVELWSKDGKLIKRIW